MQSELMCMAFLWESRGCVHARQHNVLEFISKHATLASLSGRLWHAFISVTKQSCLKKKPLCLVGKITGEGSVEEHQTVTESEGDWGGGYVG